MKKYIINFLAVFLAMTMLVSCGKAKKPTKSEKPKDNVSTQTEQIDDTTSDNKDNISSENVDNLNSTDDNYDMPEEDFDYEEVETIDFSMLNLVYESNPSNKEQYLVDTFYQFLNRKYFMLECYDDKKNASSDTNEIIIGTTNRPESAQALKKLTDARKNCDADFIIMVKNGNVVINATSNYGLNNALEYFKETFCKEYTTEIPENYIYHHKAKLSSSSASLLGVDIGKYTIVTKRDMSFIYSKEVDTMVDYICSTTGIEIPVVDDRTAEGSYEILVGNTNRQQSNIKYSKDTDYSITQNGKKIVVSAGSDIALSSAIKDFTAKIKKAVTNSKKIAITSFNEKGSYSPAKKEYQLVWNDEFEGSDLDLSKWKRITQSDTAWDGAVCKRTNTTENSYLEDGKLIIKGIKGDDGNYTAAKLSTADSLTFNYGYYEIRAKLPDGPGLWPGFWSVPTTPIYPEIDVFEMFGVSNKIQFNNLIIKHTF